MAILVYIRRKGHYWRVALALWGAALLLLMVPARAEAHPLGNFSVNRYSRLEVGGSAIYVTYIIDMAEIPTLEESLRIDSDKDKKISDSEREAYLAAKIAEVGANLHLTVGDKRLALENQHRQLEFFEGQGGLAVMRLNTQFVAQLPPAQAALSAAYEDNNYAQRPGWQEVVVRATSGARLLESSAPSEDASNELKSYPQDQIKAPLAVNKATFRFEADGSSTAGVALPGGGRAPTTTDSFAALIATPLLGPLALPLTLLVAFSLGAAHALAPGHGKTVVAAYLVGSRGTIAHAIFLGLTTTITHTAGVFALGVLTLFLSHYILPETLYPWLEVISGILVVLIGGSLLRSRWMSLRHGRDHDHGHDHSHDHDHDHDHSHDHGHVHSHGPGQSHSHMPPGADGSAVTWRSLLALGVSGGLLPCPSALVVMLSAISLGRVGFGLVLIIAFSLGLASVLTAIGMLLVYAHRLFERLPTQGRLLRVLPVVSALAITLLGVGITLQALVQTGVI